MDIKANDNELQKAIDNITNQNNGTAGASELEAQIQSQMGVPPVPPVPEATTAPVMPDATVVPSAAPVAEAPAVPDMAATVPEAPVAEPTVPVPETTATEEAPAISMSTSEPSVAEPVTTEVAGSTVSEVSQADTSENVNSVKGAIARDLYGLLDMVEAEPEEKFKVVKEMIEETGDKSMIVKGYDEAKAIADEKEKAEALMFLFENA